MQQQFKQMKTFHINEVQQQSMRNEYNEGAKARNASFDTETMDTCATPPTTSFSTKNYPFVYDFDNISFVFQCTSVDNYIMKCPRCKVETKYIIRHLSQKTSCKDGINQDEFRKQFFKYKKGLKDPEIEKQKQREWKASRRARLRTENDEIVKKKQREDKEKTRAKMRIIDPENVKKQQKTIRDASNWIQ